MRRTTVVRTRSSSGKGRLKLVSEDQTPSFSSQSLRQEAALPLTEALEPETSHSETRTVLARVISADIDKLAALRHRMARGEFHIAQRILDEEARRREAIFQQSVDAEKTRGDALSRRFDEALRQAHQEPVTRPSRDFDLD